MVFKLKKLIYKISARHDIIQILLKFALNTNQSIFIWLNRTEYIYSILSFLFVYF